MFIQTKIPSNPKISQLVKEQKYDVRQEPTLPTIEIFFGDTRSPICCINNLTLNDMMKLNLISFQATLEIQRQMRWGEGEYVTFGIALMKTFGGGVPSFDGLNKKTIKKLWNKLYNYDEWLNIVWWSSEISTKLATIS
jgi:hypothetical protein